MKFGQLDFIQRESAKRKKYWRSCALTTKRLIMDSKELLEKAKQAYYNVQHKEYTKRSFIAGYLIGYAEQLCQYNVSGRNELLLAFIEHIKKDNELTETVNANDVEAFFKSQQ